MKNNFEPYPVGKIMNPLQREYNDALPEHKEVTIKYPSRLEAMALDPGKITENKNMIYKAGQINFTVGLFKKISVRIIEDEKTIVENKTSRDTLVKHSVALMKDALDFDHGVQVEVDDPANNLRHCGLGTSSSLISGVAVAINELYGNPIERQTLVRYLVQNHGEEIDNQGDMLMPVQAIGGSANCGTHPGGMIVIAGESVVIQTMDIDKDYEVIIGVPKDYEHPDSKELMEKEEKNFEGFSDCGSKFSEEIAYRVLHEVFPAMKEKDLTVIGDLIADYRYDMGSIENCSFVYPPITEIADNLRVLRKNNHADILSMSSVGPGMFAITKEPEICNKVFKENSLKTLKTKVYNGKYKVLKAN